MTESLARSQGMPSALSDALQTLADNLYYVGAALLCLLLGWAVASILRALTLKTGAAVNSLLSGLARRTGAGSVPGLSAPLRAFVGNVVFWLIILLAVLVAARVARLETFTIWLDRLLAYLPTLLAGGLVVLVGFLAGGLVRNLVHAGLRRVGSPHATLYGLLSQGAILVAALVIGLDQVGIDVTFLTTLVAITVGGLLLAVAIAFGLGARVYVSNLIGMREVQRMLAPGQTARLGELQGRVLEFTATAVILTTEHGRLVIPARLFQEQATLIMVADPDE